MRSRFTIAAVAAGVLLAYAVSRSRPASVTTSSEVPATVGFDFCASRVPLPTKREESAWSYPLVFGLLLALSPAEAHRLAVAVEDANHRWEARANPFVEDLEDGDPDDALAKWVATAPEAARTAVTAAQRRFCGADGWCVRVVARGAECPAGHERVSASDRAHGRARFLAWPFGHAVWLRGHTPAEAASAASSLRTRATKSELIGFVLHVGDDEAARTTRGDLRDALVEHEILRRRASGEDSEESDAARPFRVRGDGGAASQAFPAGLGPLDVVVLPRLSVVDKPGALEAEIRAVVPALLSDPVLPDDRGTR